MSNVTPKTAPARVAVPADKRWRAKAVVAIRLGRRFARAIERLSSTRGYEPTQEEMNRVGVEINKISERISQALAPAVEQSEPDIF